MKPQQEQHSRTLLIISREEAELKIQTKIEKGKEIQSMNLFSESDLDLAKRREKSWEDVTYQSLESMFSDRRYADEFLQWLTGGVVLNYQSPFHKKVQQFEQRLTEAIDRLEALIEKLPDIPTNVPDRIEPNKGMQDTKEQKVFIIHGRADQYIHEVARFIEKVGLTAIILREQPSGSFTLAENLDKYSNVKFALLLLTADDVGKLKTDEESQPRARQNPIYELGKFQEKLGKQSDFNKVL
jgi:hypothetical protein